MDYLYHVGVLEQADASIRPPSKHPSDFVHWKRLQTGIAAVRRAVRSR